MSATKLKSAQLNSTAVQRGNEDTGDTGSAVISKVIPGQGISLSSTGVDAGTGDVTITSFPNDYHEVESNTQTNTALTSPVVKTTLTWTPPVAGTYIINWYFELANNSTAGTTNYIVKNGVTVLSQATLGFNVNQTNNGFIPISGFMSVSLTAVSQTFTISYNSINTHTSYIQNARLKAVRVA